MALGGGGAKGLAHIGVIKALKRAGIPIDFIAGTSMGALVGGWYAATGDIEFLEETVLKLKYRDIFPIKEIFRKSGALFRGDSVMKLMAAHFKDVKVENCKIPFSAVATDFKNGDEVVIKKGKLVEAVRASISLPIVFSPASLGSRLLIDGGFSNPVPADVVRAMGADFVVAVDVSSKWLNAPEEVLDLKSIYSVISSSLSVVEYQLAKNILKSADLVLRPPVLNYGWLEFERAGEIISIGREEVELHLKEIRSKAGYPAPQKTVGEKFLDFLFHGGEGW